MLLPGRTRKELQRLNLHARKGLGQHFLVDQGVLKRIVTAADLTPEDVVIEVGAGLGILTAELARRVGKVVAVEVDDRLASALKQSLASCDNVIVVVQDILQTEVATLLTLGGVEGEARYKVVANLPYYIASAVLRHFLEALRKPQLLVVTVQKEVAQQIVAQPGRMSLLSVSVQLYGRPAIIEYVPSSSFYPRPKVNSAVVRIDVYERCALHVDEETFFGIVRGGFSAPRKQLHNSLAQGLQILPQEAVAVLERAGIDQRRRAETLNLEEWGNVYRALIEKQ